MMDWINDEGDEVEAPAKQRKRGRNRDWVEEREFANSKEAEDYVNEEDTWAKHGGRFVTAEGVKQQYRCNKMKKGECPASVQLLYNARSNSVTLFRCDDHQHDGTLAIHGIPKNVKEEIKRLYHDGVNRPRLILKAIKKQQLPVPSNTQMQNFLQRLRKEARGTHTQPTMHQEEDVVVVIAKKRKRGRNRNWVEEREFASHKEAQDLIKSENMWAKHGGRFKTAEGVKQQYRCNKMKRGECPASLQLCYEARSNSVMLSRCDDHEHNRTPAIRGIPRNIKQEIIRLYRDGLEKPRLIAKALRRRKLPVPTNNQLQNFLQRVRKEEHGPAQMTLDEFQEWCMDNSALNSRDPSKTHENSTSICQGLPYSDHSYL